MTDQHPSETPEAHVEVVVVTTSGRYPAAGSERVAAHQPVRNELEKAARELHIVDTVGWIARVRGRELDIEKSYLENNLTQAVKIDYGPREGGGGNE
jgi:hypothetical protein